MAPQLTAAATPAATASTAQASGQRSGRPASSVGTTAPLSAIPTPVPAKKTAVGAITAPAMNTSAPPNPATARAANSAA
ncbi:hypothetical protein Vau01_076860 [Virgisporangium aurantiacum]|uniref:Uncharacterized protein n=1 Tax=Virgisporangium aurantiacum TaxID=175570 RepID=A0A8J3ZEH3_9ACTN|nr:hypothetical protein Vau01_076860 [Virgisporangium aurantiacum]